MKVIHQQNLIESAMIVMSGDMFSKIYELQSDWVFVTNTIKSWARQFVDELIALGYDEESSNNEVDFIFELEKFEDREFEKLAKAY